MKSQPFPGTASFLHLFTCHCFARCFRAECAEIPRAARAKLHEMQFLCIAKRVTVNDVNSNTVHIPLFFKIFSFRSSSGVYTDFFPFLPHLSSRLQAFQLPKQPFFLPEINFSVRTPLLTIYGVWEQIFCFQSQISYRPNNFKPKIS